MKNNITAIIVVHNEERFIRKCLDSIKDLCQEIFIIHDGKCQDNSLKIASEFTDKIFEWEKRGALEPHLVDALSLSKNNWVMRLDVDEYLSDELRAHIRELDLVSTGVTHFKASWRSWCRGKIAKQSPYLQKILIFNKNYSVSIGVPHQAVFCPGKGIVLNGHLEHTPDHINYGFFELIFKKLKPLAKNDAKLRFYSPVKIYPNHPSSLNLKRNIIRNKYPLLTMPLFACNAYLKSLWQLRTARDWAIFRAIFVFAQGHLIYQILLSYYLKIEKTKLKLAQQAKIEAKNCRHEFNKLYDEEYFEKGAITGKSCYINYRWMPELTIRMFYYMVKDLPIKDGSKILDYGCAKGYLVRAGRILNFESYGVDLSEYAISKVDPEVKQYCKLIRNGFSIRSLFDFIFDWVISKDVFEHIPESQLPALLGDLSQSTREMFVVVPIANDDVSHKFTIPNYDNDPTHFTIKSDKWWAELFENNGFMVERMMYNFRFCKEHWTDICPKGNAFYVLRSKTLVK